MPAAVKIHEMTASTAGVDKTSGTIRFKSANSTLVDTSNRLSVPGVGTNRSFTKQIRFYVATAPSVDIQNLAAYTDGANSFGTGVSVAYTYSATENFVSNASSDISGADLFDAVAGTPIDMDAACASSEFLGTGYKGGTLKLQMAVASTASAGTLSAETLTMSYDET